LTPLAVTACLLCALAATAAQAEHYRVTRHDDPRPARCKPDDCSLREAIRAANRHPGRDMVVLPDRSPDYGLSRQSSGRAAATSGDLDIAGPIVIRHGVRGRATINAHGIDRVLEIRPGASTKLARINVTGGDARVGGGVLAHARLRLVRTVVLENRADSGGGIFTASPLSLNHSRIRANGADVGGGIDSQASPVLIVRSTVVANRATHAGGGLAINGDTLRLGNSTVSRNTADGPGGGVYLAQTDSRITKSTVSGNVAHASGGGVYQSASSLFLVNSTITRNRADGTGGGVQSSITGGDVTLNSVTVARNVANASGRSALGGGLSAKGGSFGVVSSIVALNQAGARASDCHGTFDSFGGNLMSTMAGCRGFVGSALIAPDPKLGSLQDNGGPTKTLALLRGSPAIGRANPKREPAVDQRDRPRFGQPDSGAFERSP
jgi:hypothetical protein